MNILIIGFGSIGKRHFSCLREACYSPSFYIVEPSQPPSPAGCLSVYPTIQHLPEIHFQLAVICTPPDSHLLYLQHCLGCSTTILLEKPIGLLDHLPEFTSLLNRFPKARNSVFVGYCHRFAPYISEISQLINNRIYGYPRACYVRWGQYLPDWHPNEDYRSFFMSKRSMGGGAFMDEVHVLDLLGLFFGTIDSMHTHVTTTGMLDIDSDDVCFYMTKHTSGTICNVVLDLLSKPAKSSICVYTTQSIITWDRSGGIFRITNPEGILLREDYFSKDDLLAMYASQTDAILNTLSSGNTSPLLVTLEQSMAKYRYMSLSLT